MTVFVLFFHQRFYYFVMHKYDILRISTDSIWWWIIQNWYLRGGEGFDSSLIQDRINHRLPTDIFWEKSIVFISQIIHVDLLTLNLFFSALVHILLSTIIFLFGQHLLKTPKWAALFTIFFMHTSYAMFIRYPIFAPKMFGFLIFPLMVWAFLTVVNHNKGYFIGFVTLLLGMVTYFISFSYVAPAIGFATICAGIFRRLKTKEISNYFKKQLLFWSGSAVIAFIVMNALKGGLGVFKAPPIEITELIYLNHALNLLNFGTILLASSTAIVSILIGLYLLHRYNWNDNMAKTVFCFAATIAFVLLICGLAGQALAAYSDVFRTLWFWRAAYYLHLPATICFFIGLQSLPYHVRFWKLQRRGIIIFLSLSFLIFSVQARLIHNQIPMTFIGWAIKTDHKAISLKNSSLRELIFFGQQLPEGSRVLMPPIKKQSADTDIFEAESGVPVVLSRGERMHLIHETPKTYSIANDITKYRRIISQKSLKKRANALLNFCNEKSATHIMLPHTDQFSWAINSSVFNVVLLNEHWAVLKPL